MHLITCWRDAAQPSTAHCGHMRAAATRVVLLVTGVLLVAQGLGAATAWAVDRTTCLKGSSPEVAADAGQLAQLRSAVEATCPCDAYDGSSRQTDHVAYRRCANAVVRDAVETGQLRRRCATPAKKLLNRSTCGFATTSRGDKLPCVRRLNDGGVRCRIRPADRCAELGGAVCPEFRFCMDAADTNGDLLIDGNDGGACNSTGGPLTIEITSPESLLTVGASPLRVSGQVSSPAAILTLNGVPVANSGGSFSGDVALEEGHNTIVARAVDGAAQVTDSISVSLDQTPPIVTIDSHEDGEEVHSAAITVTGLINDIVRGTIEASQASVSVSGRSASISNRSYAAVDVPLVPGANTIRAEGTDQVGNTDATEITVNYVVPVGRRIELVGGQGQTGSIGTILAEELAVRVLDDGLAPVAGASVVFRVTQGAGTVAAGEADEDRAVAVETDGSGNAATPFRLGIRAGVATHKVRATVVGYDDKVIFNASATPNLGNKININSGNNQRGAVGQVLPAPLVVSVTDDGANVVEGARVRFEVSVGGGSFTGGTTELEVLTDSDGRATAEYRLGDLAGLDAQRITATLVDAPPGFPINASFSATAFVPRDPGETSISGVVLDNQDAPVPGVTVRVDGTTRQAVADDQGQFRITEAPVGPVHLVADGSTATVPGEFPSLSYNLVTIAGVDNPLPSPIYMVKLDTGNSVYAGLEDVVLELASYPGFKLEIAENSVTFPDGATEGFISVTPVNASKVPMPPPNGMQPQFIVTIQPTNTRFDPPARLSLPNVDAHPPGAQVEMYSYDHDLEEFVSIGLGTVSEDGSVVRSNPGVGVVKAGWHCGSQPGGQGCTHNCPECASCNAQCNCYWDDSLSPTSLTDTDEDCKKPACQDGPKQVPDDDDKPDDECQSCKDGSIVDGSLNVTGLPMAICLPTPEDFTAVIDPVPAFDGVAIEFKSDAPGVLHISPIVSVQSLGGSNYRITGNYEFNEPGTLTVSFGGGLLSSVCDEEEHEIHVMPTNVVGMDLGPDVVPGFRRFQEYDFLTSVCTGYPTQNTQAHEFDGCSGGAPDSLTEVPSPLSEYDLFVTEPIWGSTLPAGTTTVTLPCDRHDLCYQTCGKTQATCDGELRTDMLATCAAGYPATCPTAVAAAGRCMEYAEERANCEAAAAFYHTVLAGLNVGNFAFAERQNQYCVCC